MRHGGSGWSPSQPRATGREKARFGDDLRRGLANNSIRPPTAVTHQLKETIGVLPPQDESDAMIYDNQSYGDPERAYCNGYFGMELLHLPRPPNAGSGWQLPLIVRGDFNGIKIFDSILALYHHDGNGADLNSSITLGSDEGGGQVLSLIQCDLNSSSMLTGDNITPCCFIGYASGRVDAVSATLNAEGTSYTFAISGTHHAHEAEVTDLTFVNCSTTPDEDIPVLFSACCAGKVYFYPNAINPDQNFSMDEAVLAFTNMYDCPIFSLASTVMKYQDKYFSILCTGDRDGVIRVWLKPDDDLIGLCTSTSQQKFKLIQMKQSSTQRGTGYHLVTRAMFVQNNLLVTATNNGDVRFWQLRCVEDPSRAIGKGPRPDLDLRFDLNGCHNGGVELLTNIGDVLLSSGGNDGKIVGICMLTGRKLGSVRCHPGRLEGGASLYSCVVDLILNGKDGSMISLCRDGSLKQLQM